MPHPAVPHRGPLCGGRVPDAVTWRALLLPVPGRLLDTAEFSPPPPDTDDATLTQQTQFRPGAREPARTPAGGLCCIQIAARACKQQQHSQCLLPLMQLRVGAEGACTSPCQWPACGRQQQLLWCLQPLAQAILATAVGRAQVVWPKTCRRGVVDVLARTSQAS